MIINPDKLDFWIKNNFNVLFVGKHGVGKTSIVVEAFNRNKLKWKYYSAATMDPWVDFIGVPREQKDQNNQSYLDLVRPIEWTNDSIEALFFDELNRSAKKIRNAVMELIQFKSINGKKFNNLKIIWAAINPDDDEETEYDVEKLDPAQQDRFHIYIEIPYKPDTMYFKHKYGEQITSGAMEWWNNLPDEMKNQISPRRLDYALQIYSLNGDVRDALPAASNVSKLLVSLKRGAITRVLDDLLVTPDAEKAKIFEFFSNENNYTSSIDYVLKHHAKYKELIKYFPPEKISSIVQTESNIILAHIVAQLKDTPVYQNVLKDILSANKNEKFIKIIKGKYRQVFEFLFPKPAKAQIPSRTSNSPIVNTSATAAGTQSIIKNNSTVPMYTQQKITLVQSILSNIPQNCTTDEDFFILQNICDLINCSSESTLQKFVNLGETVQFLMDRIIERNQIRDENQLGKFCRKTLYKDTVASFERFRERNRLRYPFIKDVDYKWYDPLKTTKISQQINPNVVHSNQEYSITDANREVVNKKEDWDNLLSVTPKLKDDEDDEEKDEEPAF